MSIVTGTVEAKTGKTKFGTYGILVGDKWYNSKYEMKCEKGDEVEFDDGGKNYVNKLKIVGKGEGNSAPKNQSGSSPQRGSSGRPFPVPALSGERAIIRQNAVTNANTFLANCDGDYSIEELIDTARSIEAYTAGDIEAEEFKAKAKAMGVDTEE